VEDELLQPGVEWIEQRLVMRHVLFFDQRDLGVQATRDRLDPVRSVIHVEVHRLLLGGDDRHHVHARQRVDGVGFVVAPHVVMRVTMLHHRWAPRRDLGQLVGELGGVLAVQQLVQVGVPVEVVEVFQQREVECLFQHRVRFVTRQPGGQVHRDLLVADRRLERGLIAGVEPVHDLLLLGVDPT
jgi:hypothetical protein